MPEVAVKLTEEQDQKIELYKAQKGLGSKAEAIKAWIDEMKIEVKIK